MRCTCNNMGGIRVPVHSTRAGNLTRVLITILVILLWLSGYYRMVHAVERAPLDNNTFVLGLVFISETKKCE